MSQFYDQASLVMVPSGYKAGKVYSQKPLTTDGQLTFTRTGDTATRVNADGLVEKVRTNLLTYSNTFSNGAWIKANATLTAGQVDPNGGTAATRVQFSGAGASYIYQNKTATNASASVYARAYSGTAYLRICDPNGSFSTGYNLTETWQRISTSGASMVGMSLDTYSGGWTSQDVIIAFAQFETGDIATQYIETTSAAVSVGPVANLPRIDYTGGTNAGVSACGKLLLEPQRVNLALFSESFDNAAWTKSNITVTPNAATSPDGYQNADKIVGSVAIPDLRTASAVSITSGASYTWSAYVKNAGYKYARLTAWTADDPVTVYDLDAISVVSESGPAHTSTIEDAGNGWRRITITRTSSNALAWFRCIPLANSTGSIGQNGVDGIYLWGAQVEAGSYATSYIPTLSAAVTRGADAASKTGISSLIGQTEGTLFVDFDMTATDQIHTPIAVSDNISTSNFILVYKTDTNILSARIRVGGVNEPLLNSSVLTSGRHKFAFAYKQNDCAFYVDGVLAGTSTSINIPAVLSALQISEIGAGINIMYGGNRQTLLFKTRLSNADLQTLTTL